ncbi:hypothetical protein O4H52_13945 [Sphingomonadaceae bacterium G21617-S1]|nr:hypothetical protein [Sphingomonadaceae bacterium G21617-S1]
MAKTEDNIKLSENFIRSVLEKNFRQKVGSEDLRAAAEKLCAALPAREREAA